MTSDPPVPWQANVPVAGGVSSSRAFRVVLGPGKRRGSHGSPVQFYWAGAKAAPHLEELRRPNGRRNPQPNAQTFTHCLVQHSLTRVPVALARPAPERASRANTLCARHAECVCCVGSSRLNGQPFQCAAPGGLNTPRFAASAAPPSGPTGSVGRRV